MRKRRRSECLRIIASGDSGAEHAWKNITKCDSVLNLGGSMSYREEGEEPASGKFFKSVAGIIVAILAFGAAKAIVSGGFDFFERKTTTAATIERSFESNDELARLYEPLRQYFPNEYRELTSKVAEMVRNGDSESDIYQAVFDFSRQFVQGHTREISAASSETLFQIAQTHADVARALSTESPTACAQFGFEGLQASTLNQLSPASVSQLKNAAPLMFKAAYEGRNDPVSRPDALTADDVTALVSAVERQGLSTSETETLFGDGANKADVLTKCRMTVALYAGVAEMPQDRTARLTAFLLKAGAEPQSGS